MRIYNLLTQMIEEAEEAEGLSPKSRGILYHLTASLLKHEIFLDTHICNLFDYRKEKFNKKDFHTLIKKYDEKLLLSEIDDLFDQLDEDKNGFVFYQMLCKALDSISEADNPAKKLNQKSKIAKETKDQEAIKILIEVKDLLRQTQDYLNMIDIFDTNRNGYLTKANVEQILNSFDYNNKEKRKKFIDTIFKKATTIDIPQFLQKLDLEHDATRIKLSDFEINESILVEEQMSEYMRKNSSKSKIKIQESKVLESIDNTGFYGIEDIPSSLQPYFNYGSQLDEPFGSIAREYIVNNTIFFDGENPSYSKAATWIHIAQQTNNHFFLFQAAESVLHRDSQRKGLGRMLEPKDIKQGNLGDCYFLSALAAIVEEYPELVYRLFVLEKNPAHIYGVRLFIDGIWKTIILDACFPIYHNRTFCGAQPHHKEIWVMLLEKAWAKCFKSYDNIHSGFNEEGLIAVSGAPTMIVSSRENNFLKSVEVHMNKGAIVTCATSREVSQLTQSQQQNLGVFSAHAYTLLRIFTDLPYNGSTITLLKIRNPWGRKGWKGDWSFASKKWTPALKQVVGYKVDPADGTFFISLNDFVIYFDYLNICKVNLAYRNSWVTIHSNRYQFYQTKFKIKDPGDYFFTIYQQNPRKYKNTATYEKSKSWFFLMKIQNSKIKAIASSAKDRHDNTIETTLEPGNYMIISKVNWKFWEEHSYNLTSYGPSRIKFSDPIIADVNHINDFIESKSEFGLGTIDMYTHMNASKRRYFSFEEGYGFICLTNHDNYVLQTTIMLQKLKGISILPPYNLPLQLTIFPFENVVCKFLVDPRGYNYSIREMLKGM